MGAEFAIVYDIAIAATIIIMFFSGWRRGFAKVILGMAAVIVAFGAALMISGPAAEWVYGRFIEKPASEKLDEAVDQSFSAIGLDGLSELDFSKVKISGIYADDIVPDYRETNSATFDLSDLDFSETGFDAEKIELPGLESDFDISSVNAKSANFTKSDIDRYGLGKLATAQFAAIYLIENNSFDSFNSLFESVENYIPGGLVYASSDNIAVSAVRRLTVSMLESGDSIKDSMMNGIIRPNCIIIIRTIAFALIFAAVSAVIGIIANASKLLEKIPVIGKANSLLGGVAGACQGLVIVFVVCLATRLAVSLCGGSAIIFNQSAINSTYLFKYFYEADFLNFLI